MYKFGKYIYFDKLVKYNNSLFDNVVNFNIRDEEYLYIIESKLYILNELNYIDINTLFNTLGSIWCIQPFYDGNTRTLIYLTKEYLNKFNIDIKDIHIPIFYSPDEVWDNKKIKTFIKKNY